MKHRSLAGLLIATGLLAFGESASAQFIAQTPHLSPEQERVKLKVPEGFEVQLVAAEPDIQKPMNIKFDAAGRLWVTHSVAYPFPAKEGEGRDGLTILSDFGPDGRARKIQRFADDLNIPIGVVPVDDGAIVWSIPNIWKLTDSDGDGRADQRKVLFSGFGYIDTHGNQNAFTHWADGWIYANHGFANTSKILRGVSGEVQIQMQSGNTYRFRTDGSMIERWTWGQVNPYGSSFDPLGNLYTADCHSKPLTMLIRAGYYPSNNKPHDGLGFGPETINHIHGSTGIAGVAYYASDHYPVDYRESVYIGNVITNRVHRDAIVWHGSTPKADTQEDFVVSADPWFRPVDVQLGPDGAIYIADFYNKIIGHYEVRLDHPERDKTSGRIWRIIYTGSKDGPTMPDATKASALQLYQWLGHPNIRFRNIVTNYVVKRIKDGTLSRPNTTKLNGAALAQYLWVARRTDEPLLPLLERASRDSSRVVRVHAARVLGDLPIWSPEHHALIRAGASDEDPMVRRAMVDAVGRHPSAVALKPLLAIWTHSPDEDESLTYTARVALRDAMKNAAVARKAIEMTWTDEEHAKLVEVAIAAPNEAAAEFVFDYVSRRDASDTLLAMALPHVARHLPAERVDELGAFMKDRFGLENESQLKMLRMVSQGIRQRGGVASQEMREWVFDLVEGVLESAESVEERAEALQIVGAFRLQGLESRIESVLNDREQAITVRTAALDAMVATNIGGSLRHLSAAVKDPTEDTTLRNKAVEVLGRFNLPVTMDPLLSAMADAPWRFQNTLAVALAGQRIGAEKLVAAIREGKASPRLLQNVFVVERLGASGIPNVDSMVQELTTGLMPADERIGNLIATRRAAFAAADADPERGKKVFVSICAACHQVGGVGNRIGPTLDAIGNRGLERLLEDVLDPNRNIDAAYRYVQVTRKSGELMLGMPLREENGNLILADIAGQEQSVPLVDISVRADLNVSLMPAGIAEALPENQFHDLMAFLLAQTAEEGAQR